jgi:hypothetical protein
VPVVRRYFAGSLSVRCTDFVLERGVEKSPPIALSSLFFWLDYAGRRPELAFA